MIKDQPEKRTEAIGHAELAAQLVEDTGCHRRDRKVMELKKALGME